MTQFQIDIIRTILEFLILPIAGWFASELKQIKTKHDDLEKRFNDLDKHILEIKVALIGIDGRNGMRSELANLKIQLRKHDL